MKTEFVKLAQQILNDRIGAGLLVDGDAGTKTQAAAVEWVGDIPVKGKMTPDRWMTLVLQRAAGEHPEITERIAEDAWWGPDTQDAVYRMLGAHNVGWRPDEKLPAAHLARSDWPKCWTPSDAQMMKKYGQPGTNQVTAALPYAMRLDWDLDTLVRKVSVHRLAQTKLLGALEEIRDHYGIDQLRTLGIDRFGGILNVRRKRGGTTWSTHAWGVAIDLWPSANQLAWKKDRAVFAKDCYLPMREAFAKAGWMGLGGCYDFDWMHFQLNP